ncbi:MAG: enoyl-CoA hydratase/isomerase family protein [Chloroflexi bacterium]|nr:enoyl-CoA hydratase/isomerase family protein [Chloroflexota bacterium]
MAEEQPVLFERRDDHIAIIRFNRPDKRNAMNEGTRRAITDAWLRFKDDSDLWVGILTGVGDISFSAGNDLREIYQGLPDDPWVPPVRDANTIGMATMRGLGIRKPVIAAVNGYCLGAAFAIALACDIRICSPNATFGCTEVRYSHMAGGGQATRLATMLPMGPAMELVLTGDSIDAETALRWGVVNRVVPQEQLLDAAIDLAHRMTKVSPVLLYETKEFMYQALGQTLEAGLHLEGLYYERIRRSPDYDEGTRSFAERRAPQFSGQADRNA